MALVFQRLARNFIKNGYYPTDEETIARTLNAMVPSSGTMRIFDPCAGEGVALAECKHHLLGSGASVQAFAVEYDAERAWHAKGMLDRVIHGDFQDCIFSKRSFGLLWLNPPYGDLVSDKAATGNGVGIEGKQRLEKLFYRQSVHALQPGGVMVLIVPRYVIDAEFAGWITSHFEQVRVFDAPEQRFKQIVLIGVRRRGSDRASVTTIRALLESITEQLEVLPVSWPYEPYLVPSCCQSEFVFAYTRLEPNQLKVEAHRYPTLWEQFNATFQRNSSIQRPPLRALGDWHLALALAAGQVSGEVRSKDGRLYVIKGDTFKDKAIYVTSETDSNGDSTEIRLATDRFVPVIRAIDFTPGNSFGNVYTIR